MGNSFARCVLCGLILQIVTSLSAQDVPASQATLLKKGNELSAIEQKLVGTWYGPSCGGDFTFRGDGTFVLTKFTPGQNTLTGTWSIRWDALPPTLLLTYKTSDFTKFPGQPEYEFVGKTREAKLLQLDKNDLVYRFTKDKLEWHFSSDHTVGGSTKPVQEDPEDL